MLATKISISNLNGKICEVTMEKVPKKGGEGFPGLDLNSGWNWTPIKKGWLGSSIICTYSSRVKLLNLGTIFEIPTTRASKRKYKPPCASHFHLYQQKIDQHSLAGISCQDWPVQNYNISSYNCCIFFFYYKEVSTWKHNLPHIYADVAHQ